MSSNVMLYTCTTSADFAIAKSLTVAYFQWLGMNLDFQNTKKEFEVFHEMYGASSGCFIYLKVNDTIAGGVGIRRLTDEICEMKRLYVSPELQGDGFGRRLCDEIILIAKNLGYVKMRLDTVSKLKSANALYEKLGFDDIPAYYDNPDPTVRYMELTF